MKNRFYAGTMGDTCNGFNTVFMREVFNVAKRLLSPREYEIFYLHAVEGWTFAELGQKFSISASRLRQLYIRSQEELAKHIDMNNFFMKRLTSPLSQNNLTKLLKTSMNTFTTLTLYMVKKKSLI